MEVYCSDDGVESLVIINFYGLHRILGVSIATSRVGVMFTLPWQR